MTHYTQYRLAIAHLASVAHFKDSNEPRRARKYLDALKRFGKACRLLERGQKP